MLFLLCGFQDRSWSSCWRGSELWRRTDTNLWRLSSSLLLPRWQRVTRTPRAQRIRRRKRSGTLEASKRRGWKEMMNLGLMLGRKKEKRQLWSFRQTGGSTDRGYVMSYTYEKDGWEKWLYKNSTVRLCQFLPDSSHVCLNVFSWQDIVMLQSVLRGHCFRESQLKVLVKDAQKKVLPVYLLFNKSLLKKVPILFWNKPVSLYLNATWWY